MSWVKELKIKKRKKNDGVFKRNSCQWAYNLNSNNGPGTQKTNNKKKKKRKKKKKKTSVLCGYFCLFFIKQFQDGNSVTTFYIKF